MQCKTAHAKKGSIVVEIALLKGDVAASVVDIDSTTMSLRATNGVCFLPSLPHAQLSKAAHVSQTKDVSWRAMGKVRDVLICYSQV